MTIKLDSSPNRRKLRQLAGVAHTRELGAGLSRLEADFATWRRGEIDPFELSDRIHRFHDDVSRGLYALYNRLPPSQLVARAVALQILQEADLPAVLLEALERDVQYYREPLSGLDESTEPDE